MLTAGDQGQPGLRPGRALPGHGGQHPAGQRRDQPVLLGDRDELRRAGAARAPGAASAPAPRPRRPRRKAGGPPAGSARPAARSRWPPAVRQRPATPRWAAVRSSLVKIADAVAAGCLRRVHGQVGVADQVRSSAPTVSPSAAVATPMLAVSRGAAAAEVERPVERALEPLGQRLGTVDVAVGAEDDELVAAEPADGVAGPGAAGQPLGELPQQVVADLVPEGVVDLLEAVDVEEEHGHRRPAGTLELGVDELEQPRPVGQLGRAGRAGPARGRPARPRRGR